MMKQYLLLFFVFITIAELRTKAQDGQSVYYYSHEDAAFLVRDISKNTNSILADYELPDDPYNVNVIMGPGWSPSGEKFSWYSGDPRSGGNRNSQSFIVDRQGNFVGHSLTNCNTNQLDWSPTQDLLLIGCYQNQTEEPSNFAYHIIDANTGDVRLTVDANSLGTNAVLSVSSPAEWTPSGNYFVVYFISRLEGDNVTYTMRVYDFNGVVVGNYDFWTPNLDLSRPQWSSQDFVVYMRPSRLELGAKNISEDIEFAIEVPFDQVGRIDWSFDGQYGLLYEGQIAKYTDDSDYMNNLWLLDTSGESITRLLENIRPSISSDLYGGEFNTQVWSREKNLAFIVDTDSSVHIVEAASHELNLLHTVNDALYQIFPSAVMWIQNDHRLAFVESSADRDNADQLVVYDVQNRNAIAQISLAQNVGDRFSFSPSGDLLVYYGQECVWVCLFDLQLDETRSVSIQTTGNVAPAPPIDFNWYLDDDWLIALGIPDAGFRDVIVINTVSATGEYIGRCSPYKSCFGWMP